jgi:two-component system cell cycle response regulator DivK
MSATPEKPDRPRVLLVDDYPDAREMYTEYLEFSGYEVIGAGNGLEALQRAVDESPDIILMDLSLPVMDGWEATRRLKADAATKDIIVIALTAHAMTPDEAIARRAGCDGFIAKPFDIVSVGDAVGELLRRGRRGLSRLDRLKAPAANGPRTLAKTSRTLT